MDRVSQLAREVVEAMIAAEGDHPGARVAHGKGVLCSGSFTAAPGAKGLSRAAHLSGEPLWAHVRFSNGVGGPTGRDGARNGRGIAVKLYLPGGSTTDLLGITRDRFFVRTPEDFLEFMRARRPDPETGRPDLERIGAFLGAHPETVPAVQAALAEPAPASYATCAYHGIHAFRLVGADGGGAHVRLHWRPEAGEQLLEDEDAEARGSDYLREELERRLAGGPAAFRLDAQVAEPGDPLEDPTEPWPAERGRVELGRLEVTALATDRERDGDVLVFDPTRVTDGVGCSADPILNFRTHAYSVSVERRTGVGREAMPAPAPAESPA